MAHHGFNCVFPGGSPDFENPKARGPARLGRMGGRLGYSWSAVHGTQHGREKPFLAALLRPHMVAAVQPNSALAVWDFFMRKTRKTKLTLTTQQISQAVHKAEYGAAVRTRETHSAQESGPCVMLCCSTSVSASASGLVTNGSTKNCSGANITVGVMCRAEAEDIATQT